jgi:transcriptional regulator with XRE-family HTH domain
MTMVSAPIPLLQLPPAAAPTEFYRELSERVRRMRLELGFLSRDVAHAIGMTQAGYSRFETGKQGISAAHFFKIQQLFGYPHASVGEAP